MGIPKIIATLGSTYNDIAFNLVEKMMKNNINEFRFNLSKYNNDNEIIRRLEFIEILKCKYQNDIKIMIDLPYPGKKPRLHLNEDKITLFPQQKYLLRETGYRGGSLDLIADINDLGIRVKVGDQIIYADGQARFAVVEILNSNAIYIVPNNEITVYDRKSISMGYINKNINIAKEVLEIIAEIKPDKIALSFIENSEEVDTFINNADLGNTEIISKIETETGVANISDISSLSNIMLARGDLSLTACLYNLYNIQQTVSEITKRNNRKLYVATGVLSSLADSYMPSQSDIIDLSVILKLNPEAIIFNYGVLVKNLDSIVNIFNEVCSNLH